MNHRLVGAWAVVFALLPLSGPLAQVGHPPGESPYQDVTHRQNLTAFGGWFPGDAGRAGVGAQGGPAIGMRYEFRISGPVFLTARLTGVATERTVIDPEEEDPADRTLGTVRFPMLLTDVGLALALTGQKSWHRLMPVVHGGAGLLSDLGKGIDEGGFSFGTPFALSLGAGVRYVPGGRVAVRVDVTNYMYRLRYPSSYFTAPSEDSEPVLPSSASRSEWQHHPTLTFGISYLFGR